MITGAIIGDREFIQRLGKLPERVKVDIDRTSQALGFALEAHVKARKLTGQVLRVRTGRLRASISQKSAKQGGDSRSRFESTAETSTYYVGTNVVYGVAWELGRRAYTIVPVKAKTLRFTIGGEVLFRQKVNMPAQAARPFLKPSLQEMKPMIIQRYEATLHNAMLRTLKS